MTTTHPPMHCTAYVAGDPDGCARCGERHDLHTPSVITDRTVAAEARAVEEGHHAILDHDDKGSFVRVKSDLLGHTGKSWKVRVHAAGPGLPLIFDCVPDGEIRDGHLHAASTGGRTVCKHQALAARRLEREGLARLLPPGVYGDVVTRDSRWVATDRVAELARPVERSDAYRAAAEGPGGDPFGGF
jgi:hypothetical protein